MGLKFINNLKRAYIIYLKVGGKDMKKDNKRLLQYLGLIFIAVLLVYRLPYRPYSIIQYLIPPIKLGNNSRLYLSGLIPLIIFIIAIQGLFKLERFKGKSKVVIFFLVLIILIPLMNWILDVSRTNYHWIKGDELKAIEIEESSISLNGSSEETSLSFTLDIKDYSKKANNFKIRIVLPENMSRYTDKKTYELDDDYFTYGRRDLNHIEGRVDLELKDEDTQRQLFESDWSGEEIEYEFYNEKEKFRLKAPNL